VSVSMSLNNSFSLSHESTVSFCLSQHSLSLSCAAELRGSKSGFGHLAPKEKNFLWHDKSFYPIAIASKTESIF
jgi:hypothetical protein